MSFLDIIDTFSNLSLVGEKGSEARRPRIFILFNILMVIGIFWFVVELDSIFDLLSPIQFIGLFISAGIILTIGTIILVFKLDLIEALSKNDFLLILFSINLLTVSCASFVNRSIEISSRDFLVTILDTKQRANISGMKVDLKGEEIKIRVPESISGSLRVGDSLKVKMNEGLMGFEIISTIKNLESQH